MTAPSVAPSAVDAPFARAAACAVLAAAAALAGCASNPFAARRGDDPDAPDAVAAAASAATAGDPSRAAYRLEVDAPDAALRTLLTSYLDLARFQNATGDDGITPSELARLVATTPAQARSLLETEGYFAADVTVERDTAATPSRVRVRVVPGPRTRVAEVALRYQGPLETAAEAGNAAAQATRRSLVGQFPMKPGEPWRQSDWSSSKVASVGRLRAEGYAAGSLVESRSRIDAERHTADLDLLLDSGPLFLFGDLKIEGLSRYREPAVRNVASFIPGEPYSEAKLQEYQERLGRVGLFDSVSVEIDPDPSQADAAPVLVRVRERPLQQATFGVGYSANTGQRFSVEHYHRRVFGQPWMARSKFEWGRDLKSATTELTSHPLTNNWRNVVAFGLENLTTTDEERNSVRLRVGRARDTAQIDRLYYLELTRSNLHANANDTTTTANAVSGNYQWVFRYVDSPLLPTRGYTATVQLGGGYSRASDALNGPFGRATGRLTYYRPIGGNWFTQTRIEAGQVFAASGVGIPDTLLFRAGGDDSVRGYAYRSLGPVKDGAVTSGRVLLTASAEIAHPITPKYPEFLWAVFVDAGNAADGWKSLDPALGYGAGLRYRSPVGPLRLDVAYGQEVKKARLHLSVGVAF